jgi:hypothetical protein
MGKELNIFRAFSTATLKGRADIPAQTDIAEHTGHLDCTNISLNDVKTLLGAATYSLYDLCRHNDINRWAAFSPIVRDYTDDGTLNGVLTNSVPSICRLGDFAGYNHGAATPGWATDPDGVDYWVSSGDQATIIADVRLGEVNYPSPAAGVTLAVWDSDDNLVGWDSVALSGTGDTVNLSVDTTFSGGITNNKTGCYGAVYICDTTSAFDSSGANVLCIVPGTDVFTFDISVRPANSVSYSGFPVTVSMTDGMNFNTGIYTISTLVDTSTGYTGIEIIARLTDVATGQVGGDVVIYSGDITEDITYPESPNVWEADFSSEAPYPDGMTLQILWQESS